MSQLEKLKVGTVSYLNAKPLIYGFQNGLMADKIDLVADYPAAIAQQLLENKIQKMEFDVGTLPLMQARALFSRSVFT
jgi:chorismate dehydratase